MSGIELLTLRGHPDSDNVVVHSPRWQVPRHASDDGTVQLYTLEIRELLDLAQVTSATFPQNGVAFQRVSP
jgi:hypothetical protein